MKPGDLVKYMSRTLLVIDTNYDRDEKDWVGDWIYAIELGESEVGKYKAWAVTPLIELEETGENK